jgi:hypothetical protein
MAIIKEEVILFAKSLVRQKILRQKSILDELSESIMNESKSSAGDKHETGIAMLHLEVEKNSKMLASLIEEEGLLNNLAMSQVGNRVKSGSMIRAGGQYFFVGIGLGNVKINGNSVVLVSANSPLGSLLVGKRKGDSFTFNKIEIAIEEIF